MRHPVQQNCVSLAGSISPGGTGNPQWVQATALGAAAAPCGIVSVAGMRRGPLWHGGGRSCGEGPHVDAAVAAVEQELGPIDVLVNNAGWDVFRPFVKTEPAQWERLIAINLTGALHMHHAVLPGMVARKRGRIVNIASDAARVGSSGEAVYAACKGGLVALTLPDAWYYPQLGGTALAKALLIAWALEFPAERVVVYWFVVTGGRPLAYGVAGVTLLFALFYGIEPMLPELIACAAALFHMTRTPRRWWLQLRALRARARLAHYRRKTAN